MEYSKTTATDFRSDAKSFDVRLMLSYVTVSALLLIAIYVLSVEPETKYFDLISTAFP
jgi:hypothetical protein